MKCILYDDGDDDDDDGNDDDDDEFEVVMITTGFITFFCFMPFNLLTPFSFDNWFVSE